MMRPLLFQVLLMAALVGLPLVCQAQYSTHPPDETQNIVRNGSFEEGENPGRFLTVQAGSPVIYGWTVQKDTIDYIGSYFPSAHGNRHIDLDGSPGFGRIAQTLHTQPGKTYRLTFAMAGNPEGKPDFKSVLVQAGEQYQTFTHRADLMWSEYSMDFVANGPETPLIFSSQHTEGHYCGALLDDIKVFPLH